MPGHVYVILVEPVPKYQANELQCGEPRVTYVIYLIPVLFGSNEATCSLRAGYLRVVL